MHSQKNKILLVEDVMSKSHQRCSHCSENSPHLISEGSWLQREWILEGVVLSVGGQLKGNSKNIPVWKE